MAVMDSPSAKYRRPGAVILITLVAAGFVAAASAAPAPAQAAAAAAVAAASADCPEYCSARVAPVCGEDGLPYQSSCVAACAGVRVKHDGYCVGAHDGLKFHGSASAARRRSAKESAAVVTRATMTAYKDAGFSYLGRVRLADAPGGAPAAPAFVNEAGPTFRRRRANTGAEHAGKSAHHGLSGSGGGGNATRGGAVNEAGEAVHYALRYTPAGDVYYATLPAAPRGVKRIPPQLPPGADPDGGLRVAGAAPGAGRRGLRMIIGADERGACGQPPAYPMTAVGQLDFVTQGLDFICSGALVRRDKVLTAAHCVWSAAERAFVKGQGFSAGRHRTADGAVVSPFGTQKWKHVTLVSDFPSLDAPGSDMAVVALDSEVPAAAGTMGVEAGCEPAEAPPAAAAVPLRTAGYASDKHSGECVTGTCAVYMGCDADATQHTCDTYMGQSGSPFWDARNMVRGVHVRGMPTVNEFSNVNGKTLASILSN